MSGNCNSGSCTSGDAKEQPGTGEDNPADENEQVSDTDSITSEAEGKKGPKRVRKRIPAVPIAIICPEKRTTRGNAPKRYTDE